MKIKFLPLLLVLVIFTRCGKIEEITEGVNEAKDTYDDVKEQVDNVIETVEESGLDLENINSEDLEEVIEGVAEITGEDIDTEKITSDFENLTQSVEDIESFGEINVLEIVDKYQNGDTLYTEYYSADSFDDVINYYENVLEGTDDFDVTRYSNEYAIICGMVKSSFVWFSVEKQLDDDEEKTYIVYQYEEPTQIITDNNNASAETFTSTDYSSDFEAFYEEQITILEGNPDIIIREEIGELNLEEVKEDWDRMGYPETIYMSLVMVLTDPETGTMNSTADVFIKGENINMTIYTEFG